MRTMKIWYVCDHDVTEAWGIQLKYIVPAA